MKELEKLGSLDDNIVITEDNIEKLSKIIALGAVKNIKRYAFSATKQMEDLHKQLQYDICYRRNSEPYSNGYDLVQEASCFLCNFIGRKLGEVCIKSKTRINKIDSIRFACFKTLFAYLRKEMKHGDTEDDEVLKYVESDFEMYKEPKDYTKVNETAKKLYTNDLEKQILIYYYNGVPTKLIAEFLNVGKDVVYDRRKKFKNRYMAYCV